MQALAYTGMAGMLELMDDNAEAEPLSVAWRLTGRSVFEAAVSVVAG